MVESMPGCKNILHYFASDKPPVEDSVLEEGDLFTEPSVMIKMFQRNLWSCN